MAKQRATSTITRNMYAQLRGVGQEKWPSHCKTAPASVRFWAGGPGRGKRLSQLSHRLARRGRITAALSDIRQLVTSGFWTTRYWQDG